MLGYSKYRFLFLFSRLFLQNSENKKQNENNIEDRR